MNRRELLLSAGAGTLLLATPGATARVQKGVQVQYPGVYVEELPAPTAMTGQPTGRTIFIGAFSDSLATGTSGDCYGRAAAPAGFELAQPLVEQFFNQGGNDLVLMQAARPAKGLPDYAGAIAALDRADAPEFDLLLLSGAGALMATDPAGLGALYRNAAAAARNHYAMLVIEAPDAEPDYAAWRASLGLNDPDMAAYAPWLTAADGSLIAPGAAIAGVIARTDRNTGVWQAPAGTRATLDGFSSRTISEDQLQVMNMAQINPIRPLQGAATVWGARTLSDDPQWLYIAPRRLVRWTEASLEQGLIWTVFEPNAAPLWQAVIREVTAFLSDLWRQGALAGSTASEAFWVRCGLNETMTQGDVRNGVLQIQIGFAPTRPAEFIIIQIEQQVQPG
jgi:hypothetical protein